MPSKHKTKIPLKTQKHYKKKSFQNHNNVDHLVGVRNIHNFIFDDIFL